MQGKVEIAGINTGELKALKNAETMELLRQLRSGDESARQKLIEGNLRLVLSVIKRFANRGVSADDLFQVGCIGLLKAVDRFDLDKDVMFSTYGVPLIAGELRRYLRDASDVHVSRSIRDTAFKVLQAREKLLESCQREPTVEEIAQAIDLPREDVVFAMEAVSRPVSLYEPLYADGEDDVCAMDQMQDQQYSDELWADCITMKDALSKLNSRERRILTLRYWEGRTQMEVSTEIGISQAQVSRLEKGALSKIRSSL